MLILQENHPARGVLNAHTDIIDPTTARRADIRALRLGVVNLMPKMDETEHDILQCISHSILQIEPVWIRMASYEKNGKNTPLSHIKSFYQTMQEATCTTPLDGLIITGAPVETLDFEDVRYWAELKQVMDYARDHVLCTLYLCWASLAAFSHFYGVPKRHLPHKLAGVFRMRNLTEDANPFTRGLDPFIDLCQSRHADPDPDALRAVVACGKLVPLCASDEPSPALPDEDVGGGIYATPDASAVFNLGHLEYDAATIDAEVLRDRSKSPRLTYPVHNYYSEDLTVRPLSWKAARTLFYGNFLNTIYHRMNRRAERPHVPFAQSPAADAA
jgi:homoserine O-succinyltransferase